MGLRRFVFVLAAVLPACAPAAVGTTSLQGSWEFRPGATPPAADWRDSGWNEIHAPRAWSSQGYPDVDEGWYRKEVTVPLELATNPSLALRIGEVWTDYEVFADGWKLTPVFPREQGAYDRTSIFPLPPDLRAANGQLPLRLTIHVTRRSPNVRSEGGLTAGPLEIGPLADLMRRDFNDDLTGVVLAGVFLSLGVSRILIYRRRREFDVYLWLGLITIFMGAYTFLRTQLRFSLPVPFVTLKEAEYFFLFNLSGLFVIFARRFAQRGVSPAMRIYAGVNSGLGLLVALTPGLDLNIRSLPFWQALTVPGLILMILTLDRSRRRGQTEATPVLAGIVLAGGSFIVDILDAARLLDLPVSLSPFGFLFLIVSTSSALADWFSRMHEESAALTAVFERRVKERTADLERARVEAEAANRAKSAFLANMSHEIRTPMNGVLGLSELLMQSGLNGDQLRDAKLIHSSAGALLRVIDDILELSRIEAGRTDLRESTFAPEETLRQVERLLRPTLPAGVTLTVQSSTPAARVIADASRFRQILLNLVSNAIKFTPAGEIQVRCAVAGPPNALRLTVTVADTGIGISEEALPRLFAPFAQADESTARRFGGTGLGLAISKNLVERMGGEITARSQVGRGSEFEFWIPTRAASSRRSPTADLQAAVQRSIDGGPARILVGEDNLVNQTLIAKQLETLGHSAVVVGDGNAVTDALRTQGPFDLVLLDCHMPIADGYETVAAIRADPSVEIRSTPVIALSALALEAERRKSVECGMDDHLTKPVSIVELSSAIERWRRRTPEPGSSALENA